MKLRKTDRWIVYKLSDDERSIEIDQRGGRDGTFDDFLARLPRDQCRYAVVALTVTTKSGATDPHRLLFVSWVGREAKVRGKMLHASSKAALRRGLSGVNEEYHFGSVADLNFEEMYLKAGGAPGTCPKWEVRVPAVVQATAAGPDAAVSAGC